jgi:glycine/D-amino acid oxidase-like deaminating enzyme
LTDADRSFDVAVIGGGLVGAAIAYGLAGRGARLVVLDEGDIAYRASRGNFGLVWVQSKGQGMPAYGAWTLGSAQAWPRLAGELLESTGIDVRLEQPGGLSVLLSEREVESRVDDMRRMLAQPGMPQYEWRLLDRHELRDLVPGIGPAVLGAVYCRHDGHVNPLKLLLALHTALKLRGGEYRAQHGVSTIAPLSGGGFELVTSGGTLHAECIVLASGLGNARLAPQVGLHAAVRPQRGQILVLERLQSLLEYPMATLRQTDEGTILVGDSQEEADFRETVGLPVLATLAERAVTTCPALAAARVVRTWAALRVLSNDGFPIYEQSLRYPGAFLATCHSGVTLAAAHAFELAPAIATNALPLSLAAFSARRFDVQAAA